MFAVIPVTILMMSLAVAFVGSTLEANRGPSMDADEFRAQVAAGNVASIAIEGLWGDFVRDHPTSRQLWALRDFLDARGVVESNAPAADGNPPKGDPTHAAASAAGADGYGLPLNAHGRPELDGVEIERIHVERADGPDATTLVIEVDATAHTGSGESAAEKHASVREVYTIAPPRWHGLDFALLANDIGGVLDGARIDSAARFYNADGALAGTFDTVRVGSLETVRFRGDPTATVAGVLLLGRGARASDGRAITDFSQLALRAAAPGANGGIGKITEDGFGNARTTALRPFDAKAPTRGANLFLDLHADEGRTPFTLPTSFPSAFPDNGGVDESTGRPVTSLACNRHVDPSEFHASVAGSRGTVSGGAIAVIAAGDRIVTGDDAERMRAGTHSALEGLTRGSVYLRGSANDPLLLEGHVAVDGDVVISGYVEGDGTLRARGNVYVAGDLRYADGGGRQRTFGRADDGSRNRLAIAAGGNIVIGDLVGTASGDAVAAGLSTALTEQLADLNRREWSRTRSPRAGDDPSATPNRVARYYGFGGDRSVPIREATETHARARDRSSVVLADPDDPSNPILGGTRAVVSSLGPTSGWITDDLLAETLRRSAGREGAGRGIEVDALLCTANALVVVVPDDPDSSADGWFRVNGALVAADIAILAPGGIQVNYDARCARSLAITTDSGLQVTRRHGGAAALEL